MPTDPIVHCLQELTDYDAFEKLCNALMSGLGYPDIEPLGGRSDKGRDGLHFCERNNIKSIFAFSVRQDWLVKLNEDCNKIIVKYKHPCDELVYVTTANLTAAQRDKAIADVKANFGFALKIYGLERLRVQLAENQRHLIPQHPQIFCWPYFAFRGGVSTAFGRDLVVLDHVPQDQTLAVWLARRLMLEGYAVWCNGLAPMAGESIDETLRMLIENRAIKYVPVISPSALDDADFLSRVVLANGSQVGLILPARSIPYDSQRLPSQIRRLEVADFTTGWISGLGAVLNQLSTLTGIKRIESERGNDIALQSFIPEPLTKQVTEPLWTNSFEVTQLPENLYAFKSQSVIKNSELCKVEDSWAYSRIDGRTFVSFEVPPQSLNLTFRNAIRLATTESINEIPTTIAVREILRRALRIRGLELGLAWCVDREVLYFPTGDANPQRNIPYTTVNGKRSTVGVTGFRQWGSGERATKFYYQLAPSFKVTIDADKRYSVVMRIYVRVTDNKGELFSGKAIGRRRKKVTKSWWNDHFLARTLGVIQFFGDGRNEIRFGEGEDRIAISTTPLIWNCPVSIDEAAVDRIGDFQEELATLSIRNDSWEENESEEEEQ